MRSGMMGIKRKDPIRCSHLSILMEEISNTTAIITHIQDIKVTTHMILIHKNITGMGTGGTMAIRQIEEGEEYEEITKQMVDKLNEILKNTKNPQETLTQLTKEPYSLNVLMKMAFVLGGKTMEWKIYEAVRDGI